MNNDDPNGLGLPPLNDDTNEFFDTAPQPTRRAPRPRAPLPGLDDGDSLYQSTEEDAKIAQILNNEDYAGAKLEINRRTEAGAYAYLMTLNLSDWSEDSKRVIGDKFGGGEFKAKVRKTGGSFGKSFGFSIDSAVKPRGFESSAKGGDSLDLIRQAKALTGDNTPLLMQMMQAQQSQSMQFMQMMQQQSAENMKALVTIMARPTPVAAPAQNDRVMEILLQKVLAPAPAPAAGMDINQMLNVVAKLREMTAPAERDDSPREEKSDFFSDVMRALPSILKTLTTVRLPAPQQQQIPQEQPVTAQAAPQAAAPAPRPAANPPADTAQVNKDALAQFLPQLTDAAEEGAVAKEYASLVRGAMDDDQFSAIMVLLDRDDWFAILSDAHPPVMKWSNWFVALRSELVNIADEEDEDEDEDADDGVIDIEPAPDRVAAPSA